jgi:regulator of ribonuclease activity A
MSMTFTTADLCDEMGDGVRVAEPVFRDYGAVRSFSGEIDTLRIFEDNALVRSTLETPGRGRVLVIDGGGSVRTALLGGQLAALAAENGWSGVVIYGAVRDVPELRNAKIGIKALAAAPRRSAKQGKGARGVPVTFAGLEFRPGDRLWGDEDGLLVADGARGDRLS